MFKNHQIKSNFFTSSESFFRTHLGFTLIELMIVVSIITIIGVVSFASFNGFFNNYEDISYQKRIDNYIDTQDFLIKNNGTNSYEITFYSGFPGFITSRSFYNNPNTVSLLGFDFNSFSGSVKLNGAGSVSGEISADNAGFIDGMYFSGGVTKDFSFPGNYVGTNSFGLTFYVNNFESNNYEMVYLESAMMKSNTKPIITSLSGTHLYSAIIYRNILGKKEIIGSGATQDNLENAYITIEKGGKEFNLKLSK